MEAVDVVVNHRKTGAEVRGIVHLPQDLSEAVAMMGEAPLYRWARNTLLIRAKRRLASGAKPRKKLIKIALDTLSADQKAALVSAGILIPN